MYSHGEVISALLEKEKSLIEGNLHFKHIQDTSFTSLFLQKHGSLGGSAPVHGGAPTGYLLLFCYISPRN
jgi:hypothetical protein